MVRYLLVLMLCGLMFRPADGQSTDYASARRLAIAQQQSLIIFAESDNCRPCKLMERETIDPMIADGEFHGCVFVRVNVSRDSALARVLRVTVTPTLIVYPCHSGVWQTERRIVGRVAKSSVRALLTTVRGSYFPASH